MGAAEDPVAGKTGTADAPLAALEAFLESDRAPPESMNLSDLDGFLTAVAIGPELIMPSEWLPIVWGGAGPGFADAAEAQGVLDGIMHRYNAILRTVVDGSFQPILWVTDDADEFVIASDWAEGFLQGIGLRGAAWEPLLKTRRGGELLFPILALCGDQDGNSLLGLGPEQEDRMMAEAPDAIPASVLDIADYWGRRRPWEKAAADLPPKPGRNDPCPCGSGRKFKMCCGRNN